MSYTSRHAPDDPLGLVDDKVRIGRNELLRQVDDLRERDAVGDARGAVPPATLSTRRVAAQRDRSVFGEVDTYATCRERMLHIPPAYVPWPYALPWAIVLNHRPCRMIYEGRTSMPASGQSKHPAYGVPVLCRRAMERLDARSVRRDILSAETYERLT